MSKEKMKEIITEKFEEVRANLKYECKDREDFIYQFAKGNTIIDLAKNLEIITWDEGMEMRNKINELFEKLFDLKL